MNQNEVFAEQLSRLSERVYQLERGKDVENSQHFRDGRRRVIAYRVVEAVDRAIYGIGAGCDARTRALLEKQVRDILDEHQC